MSSGPGGGLEKEGQNPVQAVLQKNVLSLFRSSQATIPPHCGEPPRGKRPDYVLLQAWAFGRNMCPVWSQVDSSEGPHFGSDLTTPACSSRQADTFYKEKTTIYRIYFWISEMNRTMIRNSL